MFSICQTEGIEEPGWLKSLDQGRDVEPLEAAERIWSNFPAKPLLRHGGDQAAYYPDVDQISMPEMDRFDSTESYYATLYHEMTHATGHPKRLGRFSADRHAAFGSESYSKEELIAEMGASFLSAAAGIDGDGCIENSAAYIHSWIEALKGDPKLVVVAAAQAQGATDHILNRKFEEKQEAGSE